MRPRRGLYVITPPSAHQPGPEPSYYCADRDELANWFQKARTDGYIAEPYFDETLRISKGGHLLRVISVEDELGQPSQHPRFSGVLTHEWRA